MYPPPPPPPLPRVRAPRPKYTLVGEALRYVIPGHVQCSMGCGGQDCKFDNPSSWSEQDQAIKGLYSSWVSDHLLAMSRPSTETIEKYDVIDQFRSLFLQFWLERLRGGQPHRGAGHGDRHGLRSEGGEDRGPLSRRSRQNRCAAGVFLGLRHQDDRQPGHRVRPRQTHRLHPDPRSAALRQRLRPVPRPSEERVALTQYLNRQRHMLHGHESKELRHLPKIVRLVSGLLLDIYSSQTASPLTQLQVLRTSN
ncbi:protein tyrosine phosphatase domain-containing protein 1 [Pseudoliparis swirei]|uniref:protein tyrosine phosphatase domain-containing protein 1 n=1 Tax=Pseudoliparis swirei TaxID=2059687 RepID=UPI0024BEEAC2|nr:protein tyrosine phosphatase domain-containing protein 1 [Pseudoliparis swirei]